MKEQKPWVGMRAKFFHPRTLGVMHWGKIVKIHKDGTVTVLFDVDSKKWRTVADAIGFPREVKE